MHHMDFLMWSTKDIDIIPSNGNNKNTSALQKRRMFTMKYSPSGKRLAQVTDGRSGRIITRGTSDSWPERQNHDTFSDGHPCFGKLYVPAPATSHSCQYFSAGTVQFQFLPFHTPSSASHSMLSFQLSCPHVIAINGRGTLKLSEVLLLTPPTKAHRHRSLM